MRHFTVKGDYTTAPPDVGLETGERLAEQAPDRRWGLTNCRQPARSTASVAERRYLESRASRVRT